jgi:hypothetical protein
VNNAAAQGRWSVAEVDLCGGRDPGAGRQYPSARCGLTVLYLLRQRSISTFVSHNVPKIVPLSSSSRSQCIVAQGRAVSNSCIEHPRQSYCRRMVQRMALRFRQVVGGK